MTRIAFWLAQYQLKSKTPARRLRALQKLRTALNNAVVALDEKITIALLDHVLTDPEAEVRREATAILGDLRDVRTLPPLIRALSDRSEAVQEIAIQGIKRLDDRAAITALVPKLIHGTATIQWRAAQTLKSLGWRPQTEAEQICFFIALGEIKQLEIFGSEAVKPLLELLRTGTNDKKIAAVNVLGEIGDPAALKPLQSLLRDADPFVRSAVVYAFERAGFREAAPALVNLLKDSARNVRLAAALALGTLGDAQTVEPLIQLLNDKDWEIRRAALETLGKLGDTRAFPSVAKHLDDADQEVREVAADALGNVGNESIVEKLVFTMVDAHSGVRQAAARALTRIYPRWESSERVRKLLPEIQAAMKHRDVSVQSAATSLFQRVAGPELGKSALSLNTTAESRTPPVVTILRELLRATDADLRRVAVESIGRMKLKECADDLKPLLKDADEAIQLAAQNAVARLAVDDAAAGPGKVTFLSKTAPAPVMAVAPSSVADVLICSALGEVLHEWKCQNLADWLKVLEYISPPAEELGQLMTLGDFQRLEILTPEARLVIVAALEGCVMLRLKNISVVPPVSSGAAISEAAKEQSTEWLRRTPSVRGVLLRGLRFPDQTIVCDVDSRDLTSSALEQSYRLVADTFQWLAVRKIFATQLVWSHSRAALHCGRRGDKTVFGVMASTKNNETDLPGLNRQLTEFQELNLA